MRKLQLTALSALLLASFVATAADTANAPKAEEASIPFANQHRTIRDWQADGQDGLWIQDERRNWYYAKMLGPCWGLDFATTIGFRTGPGTGSLDKFSSIVVPGDSRCQFTSLTRSAAPPPKNKNKGKNKDTDKDKDKSAPATDTAAKPITL